MADPVVRQRISERTKAGMRRAARRSEALQQLYDAWNAAPPEARRAFVDDLVAVFLRSTLK